MAFHRKIDVLNLLKPDVAVICECAKPELWQEKINLPGLEADPVWVGTNLNKGLAVLPYNGYHLTLADKYNPSFRFIAPILVKGEVQSY